MPTINLHYSESLVRRAIQAFWWRTVGPLYLLVLTFLSLYFGFTIWRGDRSWRVGVIGSVLILAIVFSIALYVVHYRGTMARFRRMKVPEGVARLGDDRLHLSSDAGDLEMPWTGIIEVWRFPDFWLLFMSKAQFFTLPTADLDAEAQEFILAKAKANRIKVA